MPLTRVPTGVPGLDDILGGGLMKAGVYMLQGEPGAGKTILANQIGFHHVAGGGRVAYVTLLSESHARMLQHLEQLSFFRADAIPESIHYVSAFNALKTEGLLGVTRLLTNEMRSRKADLLVLDGLVTAAGASGSPEALKVFVSEVQAHSALAGCTTLLLNSVGGRHSVSPEQTMVDGILRLRHDLVGWAHERSVEVSKFRGAATVDGKHSMRIAGDGITVFPRIEVSRGLSAAPLSRERALSTGIQGLDDMIDVGGYPSGSVTVAAGYAGSGKTTLGLHFLGRADTNEPALLFGFYESQEMLSAIAANFNISFGALCQSGALEVVWQPYGADLLDELGYRLLQAVEQRGAKRVFVDGLGGFIASPWFEQRGPKYFSALANELRRLGATTLMSLDSEDSLGQRIPLPSHGISALADNVLRLHIDERQGALQRFVSIGKVRGSRYDVGIRRVELLPSGLRLVPSEAVAALPPGR
jgi:circadian clock protein KaiC